MNNKGRIIICALLVALPLIFIKPATLAQNYSLDTKLEIEALLKFRSYLRIYGYTSPGAQIKAEAPATYGSTVSDYTGFFAIDNLPLSEMVKEICLHSIDLDGLSSKPVCLPVPQTLVKKNIGPVILPPTVSLSDREFIVGQKAFAWGRSLPDQTLQINIFEVNQKETRYSFLPDIGVYAMELPKLSITTDFQGKYSFSLPTAKSTAFRIFAAGRINNNSMPNSQTIYFYINPLGQILLRKIIPWVTWIVALGLLYLVAFIYDKKTGRFSLLIAEIRSNLKIFNEKKLSPVAVKLGLQRRRIWYNLRQSLKKYQK